MVFFSASVRLPMLLILAGLGIMVAPSTAAAQPQPTSPAASPAAPAASTPSASDLETLRNLAQRVQTLARDESVDAKAKQAGASEVLLALAPLTSKYPDAMEFHVVQGYAAVIAGDEAAGRKAGTAITRLGGDRVTEGGTKTVLDALRQAGWAAQTAPAAQPQPTPAQPAEDPALARRTARKALLDGLKALPRDDANRASLDALTAMVERAVAADRTLTRVQERTLVAIVQEIEQAQDEQAKASKHTELVVAIADALATAPENPRHWAMLVNVASALPAEQVVTMDLGQQHKLTANPEMLLRGAVVSLELLGAENSPDDLVVDALIAGKRGIAVAEREALAREQVRAAAARREAELAPKRQSPWGTDITVGVIRTLQGHTSRVSSAAFSPDSHLIVTGSMDNSAIVWETNSGVRVHTLAGHANTVAAAAFSPDGRLIVTASYDNTAKIWDAYTGHLSRTISGHADWVRSAVFSNMNNLILTVSADNTTVLWNASSGMRTRTLAGHGTSVTFGAFRADDRFIVTASADKSAKVWEVASGDNVLTLVGHSDWVRCAAFSPDGSRIVTASDDKTAIVWDAKSGQSVRVLSGHTSMVLSCAFSPDGQFILTGSSDKTAIIWSVVSGDKIRMLSSHSDSVNSAAFSPDGRFIVTASSDNTAKLWGATE